MAKTRPQAGLAARRLGSRREYWRTVVDEWRRSGLGQSESDEIFEIPCTCPKSREQAADGLLSGAA
jgi:hypothetical protein